MKPTSNTVAFFCLSFIQLSLLGSIHSIDSIKEVADFLNNCDNQALIAFDVDEVLVMAQDKILRKNPEFIINTFEKEYWQPIPNAEYKDYLAYVKWNSYKAMLVEPETARIIATLQQKKMRVITLTHMVTGQSHMIASMEEWRFGRLCEIGIDMSKNNPEAFVFDEFPASRNHYPTFSKGILATNRNNSKGSVLSAFIKKAHLKPSVVVFFDDYDEHVQSVDAAMADLGIPCRAYHYHATEKMVNDVDLAVAKFQYDYLVAHEQWLTDEQARQLMKTQI